MRYIIGICLIVGLVACASKKEVSAPEKGIYVGNSAIDITGVTPTGDTIGIDSLRGNLILLDFWASWCRPCRTENKNLVWTVQHFADAQFPFKEKTFWKKAKYAKGLKVFNVSLDSKQSAWIKAIEKDKLKWPTHVSDLRGWGSKLAAKYQVRSIPSNFLIDANGIIIARNLRGEALDNFLENYRVDNKEQ